MAVDKKSDHVGNHGGVYTDMDGQTRQFTYIDHDIKPTISTALKVEEGEVAEQLREYRENLIDRILEIPAVFAADVHQDYTRRGDRSGVEWDELMLRDGGIPLTRLMEVHTLASNKEMFHTKGITI